MIIVYRPKNFRGLIIGYWLIAGNDELTVCDNRLLMN